MKSRAQHYQKALSMRREDAAKGPRQCLLEPARHQRDRDPDTTLADVYRTSGRPLATLSIFNYDKSVVHNRIASDARLKRLLVKILLRAGNGEIN